MKLNYIFVFLVTLFISTSCFSSPSTKEKETERKLSKLMGYFSGTGNNVGLTINCLNSNTIEDSLERNLYYLVAKSSNVSTGELIKNVEILIKKGADPNMQLSFSKSVLKTGARIPFVKHLYRKKHRTYNQWSTPFHAAVGTGKIELVEKLVELGAKVDIPVEEYIYPITIAVENNDSSMIFLLLDSGADINHIRLVQLTDFGLIKKLINMGADPNSINLALLKDIDLIEKMVEVGADPNTINLALFRDIDSIERLIKVGADSKTIDINFTLDKPDDLKRILALNPDLQNLRLSHKKFFTNNNEVLDLLLENGLPVNTKGVFPEECPLIFGAVKYGNLYALKKLIALGANKSAKCKRGFGETPLMRAIYYENAEILAYLLQIGCSPNEKEWTNKSALLNAVQTDNDMIINILIDAGADIEYNKYSKKTAVMYAVVRKKYIAVQTLIKRGANVNYTNKYGETPLIRAIEEKDFPIIKLLVENGAKTNIKYEGKTLTEYAVAEKVSPMIIDYLKNL